MVDVFSLVGAVAAPLLLRSPRLVNDIGLGAAVGTFGYISIMWALPHYDSKDWVKERDSKKEEKK